MEKYTQLFAHPLTIVNKEESFSLRFSGNSEALTSELLENLEDIFLQFYIHGYLFSIFKCLYTYWWSKGSKVGSIVELFGYDFTIVFISSLNYWQLQVCNPPRFFRKSETNALKYLEKREEMFLRYYMHTSSTTIISLSLYYCLVVS